MNTKLMAQWPVAHPRYHAFIDITQLCNYNHDSHPGSVACPLVINDTRVEPVLRSVVKLDWLLRTRPQLQQQKSKH